jgi:hypothetical protein
MAYLSMGIRRILNGTHPVDGITKEGRPVSPDELSEFIRTIHLKTGHNYTMLVNCTSDGHFAEIQCARDIRNGSKHCYCANREGKPRHDTHPRMYAHELDCRRK